MNKVTLINADVLAGLATLPDESVQCCVTSPPYWGLRDYGVEGQIGLEPMIEEFVEKMVEVFQEVRRVLRADGCLFLNLGDTYAASRSYQVVDNKYKDVGNKIGHKVTDGLKQKDLCGVPWRVALALQQPYYTGKIKNEKDRIWLAAMIDGEGCMFIHKRKEGQHNGQGYFRKNDSYGAGLEVANVHLSIIERCQQITGMGSICCVERETKTRKRNIPLYRWNMRSNQCREIIREIYPYLVGKQHEARLLLGCPPSGPDAEKAHASLIALHNAKEATIDFPEPKSMYEPGWYLRSDVIWSKANPMPESCTDRPTKSHEYIFLLTKSAHYFWDQEAVRQKAALSSEKRGPVDFGGAKGRAYEPGPDDPNFRYGSHQAGRTFVPGPTANLRTIWEIATHPFPGSHFATFPPELVRRCVAAGTSERGCCPKCGAAWKRVVEKTFVQEGPQRNRGKQKSGDLQAKSMTMGDKGFVGHNDVTTTGWTPTCTCPPADPIPCTVLDPFSGAGTTALVAAKMGRDAIGIELNPAYVEMSRKRIAGELGMLVDIEVKETP